MTLADPSAWWKSAVVYQVYPRSFADTGASASAAGSATQPGVGTLAGLTAHLDHLAWLGVDAMWLSPIFRSPMADFGYDVSDYCDIDPTFGDLADLDHLVSESHARGIRVLLDWVPNHTSDQHPWFQQSRVNRTNPKADWYVWRDQPPNNWLAEFTGGQPAWTFDEVRGQYYLHCFLPEQPDLNWDNPEVEATMHDTLRFWLDRGIDGFRMDVVHLIGKDLDVDDPADTVAAGWSHVIFNDVPVTHERLRRLRRLLDSYPDDKMSVGEVYLLDEARMADYYGSDDELHLNFNFPFLWAPLQAEALRKRIELTVGLLATRGACPTWVLSNHDVPRHRQRYGGGEAEARIAAAILLTLPGTAFMFQGEELGLVDAVVPPERVVDPGGRDGCRAPLPWTSEPLHGWAGDPWLPFPPHADTLDVASQRADPHSILHFYQRLLRLRRSTPDLQGHDITLVDSATDVLSYRRGEIVVLANLGDCAVVLKTSHEVLLSTEPDRAPGSVGHELPPRAAWIGRPA